MNLVPRQYPDTRFRYLTGAKCWSESYQMPHTKLSKGFLQKLSLKMRSELLTVAKEECEEFKKKFPHANSHEEIEEDYEPSGMESDSDEDYPLVIPYNPVVPSHSHSNVGILNWYQHYQGHDIIRDAAKYFKPRQVCENRTRSFTG